MEVYCLFELLSGHEKIITKSRISLNAGTLNRGFTVCMMEIVRCIYLKDKLLLGI
jgi:hypothetical protein